MRRARNVTIAAAAVAALAIALAVSGAGSTIAATMKPLLVQDVDAREPFTVFTNVNAGEPSNCQPIHLPAAGDLLVQSVSAWFTSDADAFLVVPATALGGPPGQDPRLGFTSVVVMLEAAPQNIAATETSILKFDGLLRIGDATPTVPDVLYRTADDPVELCARDDRAGVGAGGDIIVSGEILP